MGKNLVKVNDTFEIIAGVNEHGEIEEVESAIFMGSRKTVEINDNWRMNIEVNDDNSFGLFGNIEFIGGNK